MKLYAAIALLICAQSSYAMQDLLNKKVMIDSAAVLLQRYEDMKNASTIDCVEVVEKGGFFEKIENKELSLCSVMWFLNDAEMLRAQPLNGPQRLRLMHLIFQAHAEIIVYATQACCAVQEIPQ